MSQALVVGAGAVGAHAVAQLSETPGVERVLVADLDPDAVARTVEQVGGPVRAVQWTPGEPFPAGTELVVCALPAGRDVPVVAQAIEARLAAATCGDAPGPVADLLELDDAAREAGVAVAVGAGLAPGLSEVLARYAAEALDEVTEVHVARTGAAGPACEARRRRALVEPGVVLEGGALMQRRAGGGRRLVYFPPPVGPHDCRTVASPVPQLVHATLPALEVATVRGPLGWEALLPGPMAKLMGIRARGLAALHVEVRGRRGAVREHLTFGLVDRMAPAVGSTLAVAGTAAAGMAGGDVPGATPGVHSLGLLAPPVRVLGALRRRGVRVARFLGDAAGGEELDPLTGILPVRTD